MRSAELLENSSMEIASKGSISHCLPCSNLALILKQKLNWPVKVRRSQIGERVLHAGGQAIIRSLQGTFLILHEVSFITLGLLRKLPAGNTGVH